MEIYLPIAGLPINLFVLLGLGGAIGLLSGIFGVGGGFLMTPALILLGVPSTVAVGTEAAQILATSFSGMLAHWRNRNVEVKLGLMLIVGGLIGSTVGVFLFRFLTEIGQIDLIVQLSYVVLLGSIGSLMLAEILWHRGSKTKTRRKLHPHYFVHRLPLRMRFRQSKLYISIFVPLGLGFFVGVLSAVMGVGGGFIMVPAMIYLLGMSPSLVVGTSLFQITFVTFNATLLQSGVNQSVDLLLAGILLIGSTVGVQFGVAIARKIRSEQFRFLLAFIVIATCLKLLFDLFTEPANLFQIQWQ